MKCRVYLPINRRGGGSFKERLKRAVKNTADKVRARSQASYEPRCQECGGMERKTHAPTGMKRYWMMGEQKARTDRATNGYLARGCRTTATSLAARRALTHALK